MIKKLSKPKENELVVCTVKDVLSNSAWCEILEYPEYKGLINANEVPSVYDIKEVLKVGKRYVAKILKIDEEKKIVELSIKRVKDFEEKAKWEEFKKEQRAIKIFELLGKKYNKSLDEIFDEVGNKILEKYGSLYDFISKALENKEYLEEIPKKYRRDFEEIIENLKKRKKVKISFILTAQSFKKRIDEIKNILDKLESVCDVKYLGAGKYLLVKFSENPKKDEKNIIKNLEKLKGEFEIFSYEKVEKV